MMDFSSMVEILSQLTLSAVATFLAILLWSNTRDTAWMFIVMGIILWFGRVMYSTLALFGIVQGELYVIAGLSLVKVVFFNLPYLFFIIAFIIMIVRNRVRYETISAELRKQERKKTKELEKTEGKPLSRRKKRKMEKEADETSETSPAATRM